VSGRVLKRSIMIDGHRTSVSLEDEFWTAMKSIANRRDVTLTDLIESIDRKRGDGNLSSAIRVFVLAHYRDGRA
jgi:predicted DNA-binding ribbon-helix-helix protein